MFEATKLFQTSWLKYTALRTAVIEHRKIGISILTLMMMAGAGLISSCAWVPTLVSDSGVIIEMESTSSGRITSTHFWRDRRGYQLHGEVVPHPITKGPMGGHVDIVITAPNETNTVCTTVRQRTSVGHVRKPFYSRLDEMPTRGSIVKIKHHDSLNHRTCVG